MIYSCPESCSIYTKKYYSADISPVFTVGPYLHGMPEDTKKAS